jgi:hypothetical protein
MFLVAELDNAFSVFTPFVLNLDHILHLGGGVDSGCEKHDGRSDDHCNQQRTRFHKLIFNLLSSNGHFLQLPGRACFSCAKTGTDRIIPNSAGAQPTRRAENSPEVAELVTKPKGSCQRL